MAVDPVPWMIENGASHSTNVVRNVSYAAFGGVEGIVTSRALEVRELATPGSSVRVFPGTVAIENRAAGVQDEMYVGRVSSESTIAIAATGGSARSDMIVAQVENPWLAGEPWADPPSNVNGPYFFLRVISNVPNTAKTIADAGISGNSAIPLARIDIPASTATITQAMITDLRTMAQTRASETVVQATGLSGTLVGVPINTWVTFGGSWSLAIPKWATVAIISGWLEGAYIVGANIAYGELRANIASVGATASTIFDDGDVGATSGDWVRVHHNLGGKIIVPAAQRGTTQTLKIEAQPLYVSNVNIDSKSTSLLRVRFEETPGSNV